MASFVQEAVRFVPVSKAAETSEIPALHSIPCRIDHTGPAPVSSYFHSQCAPDPTGQFHQVDQKAFLTVMAVLGDISRSTTGRQRVAITGRLSIVCGQRKSEKQR